MIGNRSSNSRLRPAVGLDRPEPTEEIEDAVVRAGEAIDRGVAQASGSWDIAAQDAGNPARVGASITTEVPALTFPPSSTAILATATLHPLQEWEGHVVDIQGDEFVARLIDLTAGHTHEGQEAAIPVAELSERDAARMAIGSIFRWVIGYRISPEGTRTRVSQIVFRDLPKVTADDLREGQRWADAVAATLNP